MKKIYHYYKNVARAAPINGADFGANLVSNVSTKVSKRAPHSNNAKFAFFGANKV